MTYVYQILVFFMTITTSSASESWKVVHHDDFTKGADAWSIEQKAGGTVQVRDGHLEIDDANGCTVWFRQRLSAPLRIAYTVTVIAAGGANDHCTDLNCFWMASDPLHPDDLMARAAERGGFFPQYSQLRTYYVGFGANGNTTTRLRRYPGDGTTPLLPEHDRQAPLLVAGQPMRIEITVHDGRSLYAVDGKVIFDFADSQPLTSGWFAIRTVRNHMLVDDFSVSIPVPTVTPLENP